MSVGISELFYEVTMSIFGCPVLYTYCFRKFDFFLSYNNENIPIHTYQTITGSKNWITITNPKVTNIIPRFSRSIRQHIPLILGQKGFGAAIVSTVIPAFLEPRPVLTVLLLARLATEGATPDLYE